MGTFYPVRINKAILVAISRQADLRAGVRLAH